MELYLIMKLNWIVLKPSEERAIMSGWTLSLSELEVTINHYSVYHGAIHHTLTKYRGFQENLQLDDWQEQQKSLLPVKIIPCSYENWMWQGEGMKGIRLCHSKVCLWAEELFWVEGIWEWTYQEEFSVLSWTAWKQGRNFPLCRCFPPLNLKNNSCHWRESTLT